MSLFTNSLAFEQGGSSDVGHNRLGILAGTLLSAVMGYFILRYSLRRGSTSSA